jgi:hypothetical protein
MHGATVLGLNLNFCHYAGVTGLKRVINDEAHWDKHHFFIDVRHGSTGLRGSCFGM